MDTPASTLAVTSDAAGGGKAQWFYNVNLHTHLQLTLLATVSIGKHVILLGLVIVALAALVAVYTFALIWLALLWLQTRLLFLTAALLRGCMDTKFLPPKTRFLSDQWLDEDVEQAQVDKDNIEDVQPANGVAPSSQQSFDDNQWLSDDRQPELLPVDDQQHMQPGSGKRLDGQTYIEKEEKEPELGAIFDLPDDFASHHVDVAEKAAAATWNKFAESSLQHSSRRIPRPSKPEPLVKLTAGEKRAQEQERKAQEQTSWLEKMVKGSQHDQNLTTNKSRDGDNWNVPAMQSVPTNPFNTTPLQLAEAKAFMRSVAQDAGKHRWQQHSRGYAHMAAPKPGSRRNKAPTPAAYTLPADGVPPHLRKSIEAKARKNLPSDALAPAGTKSSLSTTALTVEDPTARPGVERAAEINERELAGEERTSFEQVNTTTTDAKVMSMHFAEPEYAWTAQQETAARTIERSEENQHEQSQIYTRARPVQMERLAFYDDTPALQQPAQLAMSARVMKDLYHSSDLESELTKRIEAAEKIVGGENIQRLGDLETHSTSADMTEQPQSTAGLPISTPVHETNNFALNPMTDSHMPHSRLHSAAEFEVAYSASPRDEKAVQASLAPVSVALKEATKVIKNQVQAQLQHEHQSTLDDNLIDDDATAVDPIAFGPFSTPWWWREPQGIQSEQIGVPEHAFGHNSSAFLFPPGLGPARLKHRAAFDASTWEQEEAVNSSIPKQVADKERKRTQIVSQQEFVMGIAEQITYRSDLNAPPDETLGELGTPQFVKNVSSGIVEDRAAVPPRPTPPWVDMQGASKNLQKRQKKEARILLKEAWLDREDARKTVAKSGDWSIENMQALEATTRHYLECRCRLESFMIGGKLMEEEAKVFPLFGVHDVTAPLHRPTGLESNRRKNEVNAKEKEPARTTRTEIDVHKENLDAAYKLRMQALEYAGTPDRSMRSQTTWRAQADAKLKRANNFYRRKREVLAAAYGEEGLPRELADAYPVLPAS